MKVELTATSLTTPKYDCVFDWAEVAASTLLTPRGIRSQAFGQYYFRYYSLTNSYLAVSSSDGHVYYQGPSTSNAPADLGAVSGFYSTAGCY